MNIYKWYDAYESVNLDYPQQNCFGRLESK